jgi:hypothetical protein
MNCESMSCFTPPARQPLQGPLVIESRSENTRVRALSLGRALSRIAAPRARVTGYVTARSTRNAPPPIPRPHMSLLFARL